MATIDIESRKNNLGGNVVPNDVEGGGTNSHAPAALPSFMPSVKFMKKVGAEFIGTFILMFAGYGSIVIDAKNNGSMTSLGVALVWGITVMILVYSLLHISGAHLNPAITVALASVRRFPLINIPGYIVAQVLGAILAGSVLRLIFGSIIHVAASLPKATDIESFIFEFFITFLLMFVVCAVATDCHAVGEVIGVVVGATVMMNVVLAGPVSGCSMNPARSIGSAVTAHVYKKLWIYLFAPPLGAIAGAWSYDLIRLGDKPVLEITKSGSFLKSLRSRKSPGMVPC